MDLSQRPDLAQQQSLHLTTEVQQGLAVLQMNAAGLAEYVDACVAENIVFADGGYAPYGSAPTDVRPDESASDAPGEQVSFSTVDANRTVYSGVGSRSARLSTDALLEGRGHGSPETFDHERRDMSQRSFSLDRFLEVPETLSEHLMSQFRMQCDDERACAVAAFIVGNLDGSGYLTMPVADMAQALGVAEREVAAVLARVQKLHPVGVAARDLAECIRLQLDARSLMTPVLSDLLEAHLSELEKKSPASIAREMGVDAAELDAALEVIRTCNPRSGSQFDSGSEFVWPEVVVAREGPGSYRVDLHDFYLPELKVDAQYRVLASSLHDKAAVGYLKQKIREAEGLIEGIAYRNETLYKVACCIVEMQFEFLDEGFNRLRPLTMAQVAEVVGVSQSTVSRIANGNYMQTPRGTFELRFFFHGAAQARGAVEVSSLSVKQRIREMIDAEDRAKPLSDQEIADRLDGEDVEVSRRTVAKYRNQLGIPVRSARKR